MAEILSYSSTLSTAQENQVGYYLSQKYDISTSYVQPATGLPTTAAVQVGLNGTLDLGGFSRTIGSLSDNGGAGGIVALGSNTLTVGDATSTTFSGVITGAGGSLVKVGAGTLTLVGNNGGAAPTRAPPR